MTTFRSHLREDIPLRVTWLNDNMSVFRNAKKQELIITEDSQNEWFDTYDEKKKNGIKKFFTILSDGIAIGFMGLTNMNKRIGTAGVFILIGGVENRGRGIGEQSMRYLIDYAFKDIGLKSLYLEVEESNSIAINLYNKLGFKKLSQEGGFISMSLSCDIMS